MARAGQMKKYWMPGSSHKQATGSREGVTKEEVNQETSTERCW
ncbi:hypothetical protein HMPREF9099_02740 [Lachnospiraceae bacterium oral taxon 082 str. F0431]|nr:hypothetical protein HMPREF9099_02740 [Lachnospiraceae bacterium oral taxon 082 str. F0431]